MDCKNLSSNFYIWALLRGKIHAIANRAQDNLENLSVEITQGLNSERFSKDMKEIAGDLKEISEDAKRLAN